ncbi:MAG TPA: hypothetical protein VHG89_11615 [Verrucomicrobiae bacterium]|nr:hypothetical protein [Verrucomicrobiae bacterium]
MQTADEKPVLKCDNIIVSSRGLTETDGKKVIVFVPTNEIESITLKFGRAEHSPIASLLIGIIFALIGLFGLFEIFFATRGWRYEIGMMLLGTIGGSLIFDSLKQRYFLEVHKKTGMSRLIFSKNAQKDAVENFCKEVRTAYNYDIAGQLAQ